MLYALPLSLIFASLQQSLAAGREHVVGNLEDSNAVEEGDVWPVVGEWPGRRCRAELRQQEERGRQDVDLQGHLVAVRALGIGSRSESGRPSFRRYARRQRPREATVYAVDEIFDGRNRREVKSLNDEDVERTPRLPHDDGLCLLVGFAMSTQWLTINISSLG